MQIVRGELVIKGGIMLSEYGTCIRKDVWCTSPIGNCLLCLSRWLTWHLEGVCATKVSLPSLHFSHWVVLNPEVSLGSRLVTKMILRAHNYLKCMNYIHVLVSDSQSPLRAFSLIPRLSSVAWEWGYQELCFDRLVLRPSVFVHRVVTLVLLVEVFVSETKKLDHKGQNIEPSHHKNQPINDTKKVCLPFYPL